MTTQQTAPALPAWHQQKLAEAIKWMRERNLYVLDKGSRRYRPAYNNPLGVK